MDEIHERLMNSVKEQNIKLMNKFLLVLTRVRPLGVIPHVYLEVTSCAETSFALGASMLSHSWTFPEAAKKPSEDPRLLAVIRLVESPENCDLEAEWTNSEF